MFNKICIAIISAYFIGGIVFCSMAVHHRDKEATKRFLNRTFIEFLESNPDVTKDEKTAAKLTLFNEIRTGL